MSKQYNDSNFFEIVQVNVFKVDSLIDTSLRMTIRETPKINVFC